MGAFLIVVALVVGFCFSLFGLPWGFLRNLPRGYREVNRRHTNIAIILDVFIKHNFASMLDDLLVKDGLYSFSKHLTSTISEDLGSFSQLLALNNRGEWLVQRLHYLDPWHVEKAMGLDVPKVGLVWWRQALRFAAMLLLFAAMMCIITLICISVYLLINKLFL